MTICALDKFELTPAEHMLVSMAREGDVCDLSDWDSGATEADSAVRADVITALCTCTCAKGHVHYRGLYLQGARVQGTLNLLQATVNWPLVLADCYVDDRVDVRASSIKMLSFLGSHLTALHARGLSTAELTGDVDLTGCTVHGVVDLTHAHIGGALRLSGAQISGEHSDSFGHIAIEADYLRVDGDVYAQGSASSRFVAVGGIRMLSAYVGGDLQLSGASLVGGRRDDGLVALDADGLVVEGSMNVGVYRDADSSMVTTRFTAVGAINLVHARVGRHLDMSGAELRASSQAGQVALSADGLSVGGNMYASVEAHEQFTADGQVRLLNAHIGNQFIVSGADLRGGTTAAVGHVALNADGLSVEGDFQALYAGGKRFSANGQVRLVGARIGKNLDISGALIVGGTDPAFGEVALGADRLEVGGGLRAINSGGHRFDAAGQIRLLNAHIAGQIALSGAILRGGFDPNVGHVALLADMLTVDRDLIAAGHGQHRFTAKGQVRLPGAHIHGSLILAYCRLEVGEEAAPTAITLYLKHAQVDKQLSLARSVIDGTIVLSFASVSELDDDNLEWPKVAMSHFRYSSLPEVHDEGVDDVSIRRRINWLQNSIDGYTPDPWTQLQRVYRQAGMVGCAQQIGIQQEQARFAAIVNSSRRRQRPMRLSMRALQLWSWLLNATIGYGHRPSRIVFWFAGAYVFGIVQFGIGWRVGGFLPTVNSSRVFSLPWYTLDVLLPLVDLGQETSWQLAPNAFASVEFGWLVLNWYWLTIVAGWLFTTIFVAGLTGIVRHD